MAFLSTLGSVLENVPIASPSLPYCSVAPGQGLVLATRPGRDIPGNETARLWHLRCLSLFALGGSAPLPDLWSAPPPDVEVRLCAGIASTADWAALADLSTRVRAFAPRVVLRLELWVDASDPVLPTISHIALLRQARPLFVHFWAQPELYISEAARALWALLVDSGIPVAGELLLRRGGVSGVDALRDRCFQMIEQRVRPYVLVDPDWLPAEERISKRDLEVLVRGLRGWISGLAVPQWVEEATTGTRVARIPAYLLKLDEEGAEALSYAGTRHRYQNPPK